MRWLECISKSHPSTDQNLWQTEDLVQVLSRAQKYWATVEVTKSFQITFLTCDCFRKNSICRRTVDVENYELPVNSTDVRLRVSVTGAFHPLLFHITLPLEHCTPWLCVCVLCSFVDDVTLYGLPFIGIYVLTSSIVSDQFACASWRTRPPPQSQ
jgi:hypothetical protein